jgi:hypothetical protein
MTDTILLGMLSSVLQQTSVLWVALKNEWLCDLGWLLLSFSNDFELIKKRKNNLEGALTALKRVCSFFPH